MKMSPVETEQYRLWKSLVKIISDQHPDIGVRMLDVRSSTPAFDHIGIEITVGLIVICLALSNYSKDNIVLMITGIHSAVDGKRTEYYTHFQMEKINSGIQSVWIPGLATPLDCMRRTVDRLISNANISDRDMLIMKFGKHYVDAIDSDPVRYVDGEPVLIEMLNKNNLDYDRSEKLKGYNEAVSMYARSLL